MPESVGVSSFCKLTALRPSFRFADFQSC